jgi:hypothetical protein
MKLKLRQAKTSTVVEVPDNASFDDLATIVVGEYRFSKDTITFLFRGKRCKPASDMTHTTLQDVGTKRTPYATHNKALTRIWMSCKAFASGLHTSRMHASTRNILEAAPREPSATAPEFSIHCRHA